MRGSGMSHANSDGDLGSADSYLDRAASLEEAGDHYGALGSIDRALRMQPTLKAYRMKASVLAAMGDHRGASREYGMLVETRPHDARIRCARADSLAALGDYRAARREYAEAVRNDPASAAAHRGAGASLAAVGDHEGAVQSFDEAARLDPQSADVRCKRGASLAALELHAKAAESYGEAVAADPECLEAHVGRGLAMEKTGNPAEAAKSFSEAARIAPDRADVRWRLASSLAALGDHERAAAHLASYLEAEPKNTAAHRALFKSLSALGRHRDIAEFCALHGPSGDPLAERLAGESFLAIGDWAAAAKSFSRTLATTYGDWEARRGLALSMARQGDNAAALGHFEKALQGNPDDAASHYGMADALRALGRHREAASSYVRGARIGRAGAGAGAGADGAAADYLDIPGDAARHLREGELLAADGRHRLAIERYKDALRIAPCSALAHRLRGISHAALGEDTKASECFFAAYERDDACAGKDAMSNGNQAAAENGTAAPGDESRGPGAADADAPADAPAGGHGSGPDADAPAGAAAALFDRLDSYQNKLLQIDRRNRCVCLAKIYHKHNLDLSRLDEIGVSQSDSVVKQALGPRKCVRILPESSASDEAEVVRRRLYGMTRNIRQLEDETGTQYFYLGYPFLEGRVSPKYYARAPLALFPISVSHEIGRGRASGWHVRFTGPPVLNRTLFAALEKIGGLAVGDEFEAEFDAAIQGASGDDEGALLGRLAGLLSDNGIESKPDSGGGRGGPDNGAGRAAWRFADMTRDEMAGLDTRPFMVAGYRVIGSFPQGESAIYDDYASLVESMRAGGAGNGDPVIEAMLDAPMDAGGDESEPADSPDLDAVQDRYLNMVLPSDSSQDEIVYESQRSDMTLVRGPPGTGKSQVIVNAIANALARGQTVLVVCQKRAALEVVSQRLAAENLDQCAVLLSKVKDDRAAMYAHLKLLLDRARSLRPSDVETDFHAVSDKIDMMVASHAAVPKALDDKGPEGIAVRHLYARSTRPRSGEQLGLGWLGAGIDGPQLDAILEEAAELEPYWKKFDTDAHPWSGRADFSGLSESDRRTIEGALATVRDEAPGSALAGSPGRQEDLAGLFDEYAQASGSHKKAAEAARQLEDTVAGLLAGAIRRGGIPPGGEASAPAGGAPAAGGRRDGADATAKMARIGARLWDRLGDADTICSALDDAIVVGTGDAQRETIDALAGDPPSHFERLRSRDARKRDRTRRDFLEAPEHAGADANKLVSRLRHGMILWEMAAEAGLRGGPLELRSGAIVVGNRDGQGRLAAAAEGLAGARTEAGDCASRLAAAAESIHALAAESGIDLRAAAADIEGTRRRIASGRRVHEAILLVSGHLAGGSGRGNGGDAPTPQPQPPRPPLQAASSRPEDIARRAGELYEGLEDFTDLQAHDARKKGARPETLALLRECADALGARGEWKESAKSWAYAEWIERKEARNPILRRAFAYYQENCAKLRRLIEDKQRLVARRILEDAARSSAAHRGGQRRAAGLEFDLGRKRRVKPVRMLFTEYRRELLALAPCWLASPEAVSSVFPAEKGMFDLVIVDEASQLAAERALPALYRGRRKVVAGDEKQLRPHDLFQMRAGGGGDGDDGGGADGGGDEWDGEAADIESLLDLARRRYPTHTLQWHYRSRWQELIDFSNRAFYGGRLLVAPNVQKAPPEPPIQWIRCEGGMWENRSNRVEAEKVVDVLHGVLGGGGGGGLAGRMPTVGIITFNDAQRDKILDVIEARRARDPGFEELYEKAASPESGRKDDELFVRNIENVQGDEREVIIFSVGYARDADGRFRMSFGSLSRDGGENRLNVAVTRASARIVVVSSIDPEAVRADGSRHRGPRLLRDFLAYASAVGASNGERVGSILDGLCPAMDRGAGGAGGAASFDSHFEELVYDRLRQEGYEIDTQVGRSGYRIDLAVVHPDDPSRYVLGIECDGATYHSARSVRERDVFRQRFLERGGWAIARVWSRDWWQNPGGEVEKIVARIRKILDEGGRAAAGTERDGGGGHP